MKQSKNLIFKTTDGKTVFLEDFVLFCINMTIDLALFHVDKELGLRVEHEISENYNINNSWIVAKFIIRLILKKFNL